MSRGIQSPLGSLPVVHRFSRLAPASPPPRQAKGPDHRPGLIQGGIARFNALLAGAGATIAGACLLGSSRLSIALPFAFTAYAAAVIETPSRSQLNSRAVLKAFEAGTPEQKAVLGALTI